MQTLACDVERGTEESTSIHGRFGFAEPEEYEIICYQLMESPAETSSPTVLHVWTTAVPRSV